MSAKAEQLKLNVEKDKKEIRMVVKLDYADIKALETGMARVGERNKSSYIRRLIHENKGHK